MPRIRKYFKRISRKFTREVSRKGATSSASPQQQPAAPSLWDRAYNALAKENPGLVKDYDELLAIEQMANSAPDETTQLPTPHGHDTHSDRPPRQVLLNTVIKNGLQRMEDNKMTYNIGGHEFVPADQITQVANFLLWGKDLISSAVKDSPQASLAWSAVCLVLPLLTNPTTAAEANRDGFAYVTSRMRYYIALEPMVHRLGQNARVDEALISAATDHLVDLYQAILEFQLSSVLRFYQGRIKTYVHDIIPSTNWNQSLLNIKTLEQTVNNDLGQINNLTATQELEQLNKTSEDTQATMNNLLTLLKKHLQDMPVAKCLQAFYLTKDGSGATYDWYKGRVELRVEGTCGWFLRHENFQKWLSQESGPLLVSADPGCGKSVLAKYLIDHGLAQQSATICYFFFKDQDQYTILQALCALLHQLFTKKRPLIQHAMELYNDMGAGLVQSEVSLWRILRDAVRDPQAGPVIFVIDALDECDELQLRSLISNLKYIFQDQQPTNAKFKVIMTSRPYDQVVRKFRTLQDSFPRIHIPGEEEFETIGQEINHVIHHRVELLAQEHGLSDRMKSSLESKLLGIGHRTYLWVYLVFDYLDKEGFKRTGDGIDAAIQTLPETVNQAYDQMLNRSQGVETVKTVKKVLSIILAARRPLTVSEMNIAINLNGQGRGRSVYDLDLEENVDFKSRLRTLCGLFVNVHHDKVYFLHQTAREFLIQSSAPAPVSSNLQWHHSITIRHAHSVLAEICMFYLDRLNSTDTEAFRQGDRHVALFQYSAEHWGHHYHEADFERGSDSVGLASGLCTSDLTSHSQWAHIISSRYHTRSDSSTNDSVASHPGITPLPELALSRRPDVEETHDDGKTALLLAAASGHEAVTRLLLVDGANVEASDSDGRTALVFAADSGHEAVTRLLLEYRANIEAKDSRGRTALILAANSGHEAVTRLLLKSRANVETKTNDGKTALMLAANSGHEAVARLLLENHADAEASDADSWTSLMFAADFGQEAVARLLLENGANVKAKDSQDRTALMFAAKSGHDAVTRLLLENGADVEARHVGDKTALIIAAESGHEAVTRLLLLEISANSQARHGDGWTALMLAAGSNQELVTRLLLENGVDVEAKDKKGWTALMAAAYFGHEAVTRLLLENGADVEARSDNDWTALMLAAQDCHEAVARLLLEHGAEIEAKDKKGWTALMIAARYGQEAVARLLLENGANVAAKNNNGSTALIVAAANGQEAVARLLLEHGADIEAKNNDGLTALMAATADGHEDVTRLLLENGAEIEAKDKKGWTALMIAARYGQEAVARLLLENGANVEAKNNDGWTALILAAIYGHEAVARLPLVQGADVEAKDNYGWTALMSAAANGQEAVARLLLEHGADIEAKNNDGWTALMAATADGHEDVTRLLLENGAEIEAKDKKGWTALMIAARYGQEAVARLLLENGANVEAKNNNGSTALIVAAANGQEAVARLLLEHGAEIEAKDKKGLTALMLAAIYGQEAVARLLLENGANVEAKNNDGLTALMIAAANGQEAVARLLLESGADVEARSDNDWKALMIAARYGHEAVARLLLENGANVEAKNNDGWTALMFAAAKGHEAVARLLLENGANVETKSKIGWTVLGYATDENTIQLLLDNGAK